MKNGNTRQRKPLTFSLITSWLRVRLTFLRSFLSHSEEKSKQTDVTFFFFRINLTKIDQNNPSIVIERVFKIGHLRMTWKCKKLLRKLNIFLKKWIISVSRKNPTVWKFVCILGISQNEFEKGSQAIRQVNKTVTRPWHGCYRHY